MIGKTILGYTIEAEIGSGGFGTVYKASKQNQSGTYTRALKHISLPTKKQYNDVLNSMGGDYSKADNYFAEILKDIVSEIQILNNLTEQGVRNVVWYYENQIDEQESPLRYDIYILMEYLNPFDEYIQEKQMMVRDVIKLGKDILTALISCHRNNIIHRDIKDENIFVSNDGTFKLGDFGVSKKLQDRSRAESMKGTPNYIAPEVYLGKTSYDCTVDIYSLGIVLYKLLNNNRNPFLPPYPTAYNSVDEDKAFEKRMQELSPELPSNAENSLGEAIVKAISKRAERYDSAEEFLSALDEIERNLTNEELNKVVIVNHSAQSKNTESTSSNNTQGDNNNNNNNLKETIGENYDITSDSDNKKHNGNLFETKRDDIVPDVIPEEPKRIVHKADTATDDKRNHSFEEISDFEEKRYYEPPKEESVAPIEKDSFNWLLYLTPVLILLVYVVLFFVILPRAYDNTVGFIDWAFKNPQDLLEAMKSSDNVLPPIYKIILLKVVNILLFWGLIVSLYFIGRKLHFSKPKYASNATLLDKEAYYLALEIFEELKAEAIPNTTDVISAVKNIHDRLKNDSGFGVGNQSVIKCEKEIESLLSVIQSNISALKNPSTFESSKRTIITSCNRIMSKIKLRTELKKR